MPSILESIANMFGQQQDNPFAGYGQMELQPELPAIPSLTQAKAATEANRAPTTSVATPENSPQAMNRQPEPWWKTLFGIDTDQTGAQNILNTIGFGSNRSPVADIVRQVAAFSPNVSGAAATHLENTAGLNARQDLMRDHEAIQLQNATHMEQLQNSLRAEQPMSQYEQAQIGLSKRAGTRASGAERRRDATARGATRAQFGKNKNEERRLDLVERGVASKESLNTALADRYKAQAEFYRTKGLNETANEQQLAYAKRAALEAIRLHQGSDDPLDQGIVKEANNEFYRLDRIGKAREAGAAPTNAPANGSRITRVTRTE